MTPIAVIHHPPPPTTLRVVWPIAHGALPCTHPSCCTATCRPRGLPKQRSCQAGLGRAATRTRTTVGVEPLPRRWSVYIAFRRTAAMISPGTALRTPRHIGYPSAPLAPVVELVPLVWYLQKVHNAVLRVRAWEGSKVQAPLMSHDVNIANFCRCMMSLSSLSGGKCRR
jgi:hypothetical protein